MFGNNTHENVSDLYYIDTHEFNIYFLHSLFNKRQNPKLLCFLLIVELYNVKENDFFPKNVKISYN